MIKNPIKFLLFFLFFIFISNNSYGFNYKKNHEFEIFRNGKKVGFHKLSFKNIDNKVVVNTEIEMIVKIGIFPVLKYFHKGEEIWKNNQFIEAKTFTKKNRREFKFKAKRKKNQFKESIIEIKSRGKVFSVDDDTLITSYWNQNWLKKNILIDNQHGKKRLINVEKNELETIITSYGSILAQKYKVIGRQEKPNGKKINYDIWYDADGRWVKTKIFIKKSIVEYFLVTEY